ncbi:MAG: putative metal-binding motif-containing protein [Kofleriaceae bacterium]|nr:putative metal-binding motif-containing protein [Kofleriaceae bacterium]
MRALLLFVGLSLSLLFGSSCSDKEGILLNVSTDMERPIHSLVFVIGEDVSGQYFSEQAREEAIELNGRDLHLEPFKLFLRANRDGRFLSDTIVVGVLALNADNQVIGFGHSQVLAFSAGEIREWSFDIVDIDRSPTEVEGCLKWKDAVGADVKLAPFNDRDCDGFVKGDREGEDCNDDDSSINPDAEENCTSGMDENCDGIPDFSDADADGYDLCALNLRERDCDDGDDNVFPRSISVCGSQSFACGDETGPYRMEGDACFVQNNESGECYGGTLSCSDDASSPPLVCGNLNGNTVEPGFCTPDCTSADPNSCIPTELVSCFINFSSALKGSDGELCDDGFPQLLKAFAILPPTLQNCKKTRIDDERVIPDWKLKIIAGPSDDCRGDAIEVSRALGNPGSPDGTPMIIEQLDDNNEVLYRYVIDVTALSVVFCEGLTGLECYGEGDADLWVAPVKPVPMD